MTARAPIRAFLIDDEPLALKRLARLLEATGRVTIAGRATDPAAGLREVAAQPVDVLFLDIHMPGLSGFDVIRRLGDGPPVVFTTAHDRHAVEAFEVNAIDYLLKPVERQRLDRALDRVEQRSRAPVSGSDWRGALERLAEHFRAPRFLDHLASRTGDRVHLVPVDHVAYVQARERATYAVTATAEHMLDATLAELERKLDPATFFRIHRATLVNVAWVGELHAHFGGRLAVRLKGERRDDLVVSRDRVRPLKERLGLA